MRFSLLGSSRSSTACLALNIKTLRERKERLRQPLSRTGPPLQFSDHQIGRGSGVLRRGLVSCRWRELYRRQTELQVADRKARGETTDRWRQRCSNRVDRVRDRGFESSSLQQRVRRTSSGEGGVGDVSENKAIDLHQLKKAGAFTRSRRRRAPHLALAAKVVRRPNASTTVSVDPDRPARWALPPIYAAQECMSG